MAAVMVAVARAAGREGWESARRGVATEVERVEEAVATRVASA